MLSIVVCIARKVGKRLILWPDYGIRHIINFGRRDRIRWYKRLSCTFLELGGRRRTFRINDFCRVLGQVGQINQFAVVRFQGRMYVFVIVTAAWRLKKSGERDDSEGDDEDEEDQSKDIMIDKTLKMDVWKVSNNAGFFGLPALAYTKDYFIPAPISEGNEWEDLEVEVGEAFFLKCLWNVEYM